MKKLIFLSLFLLIFSSTAHAAAIKGLEEGTRVAYCKQIDFVGGSQELTATGLNCTLTSTAGTGDITDVGDCSSGACFKIGGTGTSIDASAGDLKLYPNGGNTKDITLFEDAVVGDDEDGGVFRMFRKAAEGNNEFKFFINDARLTGMSADGAFSFSTLNAGTLSFSSAVWIKMETAAGQDMFLDAGGIFRFRDEDDSNDTVFTIDSATGNIAIGSDDAGVDNTIIFKGETFDGTITNMEDENTITFSGGIKPSSETGDTCGTMLEGAIFWNSTAKELCVCDGTNDVRVKDASTACF